MASTKAKKIIKRTFLALVVIFIVIQFIHPDRNINPTVSPKDIAVMYPMPDSVHTILAKACYDCHSNNTRYPWYNNVQPVAWWLADHIKDGKEELNFSEFGSRPLAKQAKKLRKVADAIKEGWMPLDSYLWIHKDAALSEQEKSTMIAWASGLSNQIAAQVPPGEMNAGKK